MKVGGPLVAVSFHETLAELARLGRRSDVDPAVVLILACRMR